MYRVNGSYLENMPPQGWQCPVCKRVYSPTTIMCFYCGGETTTTVSSSGTGTSGYVDVKKECETCGYSNFDLRYGPLPNCEYYGKECKNYNMWKPLLN